MMASRSRKDKPSDKTIIRRLRKQRADSNRRIKELEDENDRYFARDLGFEDEIDNLAKEWIEKFGESSEAHLEYCAKLEHERDQLLAKVKKLEGS